jgi:hypothetical protein
MVSWILSQKGVPNSSARVVVSQAYDPGLNGAQAENAYFNFIESNDSSGNGGGGGGGN